MKIYIREKRTALAGNQTRVSRVAGENSITEPPMLVFCLHRNKCNLYFSRFAMESYSNGLQLSIDDLSQSKIF